MKLLYKDRKGCVVWFWLWSRLKWWIVDTDPYCPLVVSYSPQQPFKKGFWVESYKNLSVSTFRYCVWPISLKLDFGSTEIGEPCMRWMLRFQLSNLDGPCVRWCWSLGCPTPKPQPQRSFLYIRPWSSATKLHLPNSHITTHPNPDPVSWTTERTLRSCSALVSCGLETKKGFVMWRFSWPRPVQECSTVITA